MSRNTQVGILMIALGLFLYRSGGITVHPAFIEIAAKTNLIMVYL